MIRRGVLLLALLVPSACTVGTDQQPAADVPREFRSSAGGGLIEPVLILPMYDVMTGISTKGGHGPGEMSSRHVIAASFRFRPGDRFVIPMPNAEGVGLSPLFFAGRSRSLRGAAIVARDHRPRWFGDLWADQPDRVLTLERTASDEWSAAAESLRRFVEAGALKAGTDDASWFNVTAGETISLNVTAKERQMILDFLGPPRSTR